MRLWHIDLIPYLPRTQLLAQWRELNSIFKKQDNHILINYIYNYSKEHLFCYTQAVLQEMSKRGYKIKSFDNYKRYFFECEWERYFFDNRLRFEEHNQEYLTICFYNLKEKYIRGQKDFTQELYKNLVEFYFKGGK